MLIHKDNVVREVSETKLQEYLDAGWLQPSIKKKKSEKTAETAPEAAQEDLGNAINTGE